MTDLVREVSVIIPTRGNGRGLGRSVASAINQDGVTTRLIVVVDGEPSDCDDRRLLGELADPQRVIRLSRIGSPGVLRNLGLGLVRTPYVAFLDDDDWWTPSKLRRQLAMLDDANCAMCGSNAVRVEHGEPAGLYFEKMPASVTFEQLMACNWMITSSVVVRTEVLRSVGGFSSEEGLRACDDYAGWLKVAAVGGLTTTRQALVHYTVAARDSLSSDDQLSGAESRRRALRHLVAASQYWNVRLTRRQRALVAQFTADWTL
jgi:glycosyltransferase involved in cell wall biosynthesis